MTGEELHSKSGGFTYSFTDDPLSACGRFSTAAPAAGARGEAARPSRCKARLLRDAPTRPRARPRTRARTQASRRIRVEGGDPNPSMSGPRPGGPARAGRREHHVPAGRPRAARRWRGRGGRANKAPVAPTYTRRVRRGVMGALEGGRQEGRARPKAEAMRAGDAGDVMALVALGEALEATGDTATAERAYGSIVDLLPRAQADIAALRRRSRLDRHPRRRRARSRPRHVPQGRGPAPRPPLEPSPPRLRAAATRTARGGVRRHRRRARARLPARPLRGRRPGAPRRRRGLPRGRVGARRACPARQRSSPRPRRAGGTVEDAPSLRTSCSRVGDGRQRRPRPPRVGRPRRARPTYEMRQRSRAAACSTPTLTTGYGPECFTIRARPGGRQRARTVCPR